MGDLIMTKSVTAADVVQTGGTAKSPTMVLHYYGDDGSVWKIGNLAAKLSEATRNVLKSVRKGDTVDIEIKKEGNFWNLISASPEDKTATSAAKKATNTTYTKSTYSKAPAEGRLTDLDKAEGQQRGNVLTNAVNLVTAILVARGNKEDLNVSKALTLIKDASKELLIISNNLETFAETALANSNSLSVQDAQDLDDPEVTQELGF